MKSLLKKYCICIIILCFATSCKTQYDNNDLNNFYGDTFKYPGNFSKVSNPWIATYKNIVFYECIKQGYKNDSIWKLMNKEDLFYTYDSMNFKDIDTARSIGKKIILGIPKNTYFVEDEEVKKKNFISSTCLCYYASRELDSISKRAYKNAKKKSGEIINNK